MRTRGSSSVSASAWVSSRLPSDTMSISKSSPVALSRRRISRRLAAMVSAWLKAGRTTETSGRRSRVSGSRGVLSAGATAVSRMSAITGQHSQRDSRPYTRAVIGAAPTVVHLTPFPQQGAARPAPGVPAFVSRLLPAYAEAGVPLQRVLADRAPGGGGAREYPSRGVEVRRVWTPGARFGLAAWPLRRAAGDVVHVQHEVFLYGGPAAAAQFAPVIRAGRRRRPVVVTIHGVVDLDTV